MKKKRGDLMDTEKIITDIEWLEQLFRLPDNRPLQISDWKVGLQKKNETSINNPWFRPPSQDDV